MPTDANLKDTQSRKWQLTINNPAEKGLDHDAIRLRLVQLKSCVYWCMADEVGESGTYHTHIYLQLRSPSRFSRIKKLFPDAHIEQAKGSPLSNKEYILKEGRWKDSEKAETRIPDTFSEWGELPEEPGQGFRSDLADLYQMISDGLSNAEIMARNPEYIQHIGKMDKVRLDLLEDRFRNEWRNLTVTYIFGPSATGKTRSIMEKHTYSEVFRVTDYKHPFDRYASESVLCFDEFRSSLMIGEMLNYLDGYPISLPARYANRVACYETVYIVSNIDLKQQYPSVQVEEESTWMAFLRRIHKVIEYKADGSTIDHGNAMDYIYPPPELVPPSWVQEIMDSHEDALPL